MPPSPIMSISPLRGQSQLDIPSNHTAGQPPRSRSGTRTRVSIIPY
ncbi:MAG: hypothetical protein R3C45_14905 [Phycisphaerales bacterium]